MSFLKKIWAGIKAVFTSSEKATQEKVKKAVELVENIKNYVHNPAVDVITAIIPGTWDDKLKAKAREFLPRILIQLNATSACLDAPGVDQKLICLINKLNASADDARKALYHSIAVLVVRVLADGKLTFSDAAYLVEWYYTNIKKKK